ncbi:MAG: heat-inducible transcriptional repressor HrcA [Candidatus Tyrphobacter sp.]
MKQPGLDERKAYILATVVYEYVATAEPVASQTLTQKYNMGVSSATIRSEMAELEAGGYLVQPHTSAGRIPSDAGYRTYVDDLMEPETLSPSERRRIRDELRDASRELDDVIDQTTKLLGRLSKSLAFVTKPQGEEQRFKHVQLISIGPRTGVAVVVTSLGVSVQSLFELRADASAEELTRLSSALNARFGNQLMSELTEADVGAVVAELGLGDDLRGCVWTALASARASESPQISAAGAQNLLDQPEFADARKLRSILRIVEEQRTLYDIVADAMSGENPSVKIGHELGNEELADLSVVTVPYRFGPKAVGMLSILGPRRMPYARLLALASGTADSLSRRLADGEVR